MTILVTGGAGYIGSHMVHELNDAGEPVVVLDNLSTGFRFLVPGKVPFVAGSTGDRELVGADDRAARRRPPSSISPPRSWCRIRSRDPLGYYANNTMNTCALLDTAIKAGVRQFIFSSTAAVYGNAEHGAGARGCADRADLALRHLEADVGDHAARRRQGARPALRRAALFQRRRRRSETAHRPVDAARDASDQGRLRGRARQARQARRVRHRLSDAGRHLRARLHPCQRSRARAFGGARAICGAAAPARRSIAATATAPRCSK